VSDPETPSLPETTDFNAPPRLLTAGVKALLQQR